jgi:hypothetical protein
MTSVAREVPRSVGLDTFCTQQSAIAIPSLGLVNPTKGKPAKGKVGSAGGGARLMAVLFHRFGRRLGRLEDNDPLSLGQKIAVLTALSALAWACIIGLAALLSSA